MHSIPLMIKEDRSHGVSRQPAMVAAMSTVRAGVIQITSNDDTEANLEAVARQCRAAASEGAEVIVVPECFAHLGTEMSKIPLAESLAEGGPILEFCQDLAKAIGAQLILGGHWEKSSIEGKVRNACVQVKADGSVGAVYRKIHLFDVDLADGTRLMESDTVEAGDPDQAIVAETPFGGLGLSVCYDLRFPELYRRLVDGGAIALAIPAAFTMTTGKDHWHVLQRARAIEQQSYVLAAAQTGQHVRKDGKGRRQSYGHAMIVDPWGTVLAQCGEGEGHAVATIDPGVVERIRAQLPSLKHRRIRSS